MLYFCCTRTKRNRNKTARNADDLNRNSKSTNPCQPQPVCGGGTVILSLEQSLCHKCRRMLIRSVIPTAILVHSTKAFRVRTFPAWIPGMPSPLGRNWPMSVSPTSSTAATAVAEADSRVTRDLQPQVRVLFTRDIGATK